MLFREWKDFVVYPGNSSRVRSREERLNTAGAFHAAPDGRYPPAMWEKPISERAAVISSSYILRDGDTFECMQIDDSGYVLIWTRNKVWFIAREGDNDVVEKLRYYPRHPPG